MTPLRRVLVVDDEDELRAYVKDALALLPDVEVVACASGEEGLAELRARPFDVVLSDQRMGAMDGVRFLEAAAALAPDAPRILMTGFAEIPLAESAVNRARVAGFLSKPFLPEDLARLLEPLLPVRRERAARSEAFGRALSSAAAAVRR